MRTLWSCLLLVACDKAPPPPTSHLGPDEIPLVVAQRCPGDPACPDGGDGKLLVGAAKREITPLVEPFVDTDGNGKYTAGEPFTDRNGNGRFDPVWIAGYGSGRTAWGVHDPNWVRCYVLRQNMTTVAHCAVDLVGYFRDEPLQIRAMLDPTLEVDLVMMSATHVHETKDSIGIWGPTETESGFDPHWMAQIRVATVAAITEAVGKLKPAKMAIASILVEDPGRDMTHYVGDTRDPVVIDNRLHLMQFDGEDGKPIATVVNWSAHPEGLGSRNRFISSDFVHYLRETVEAGTGSDVIFVNGSVGGQIGPGRVNPKTEDGRVITDDSFEYVDAWGTSVGRFALKAFAARKEVTSPKLAFRTTVFLLHVDNLFYHAAGILGLFKREFLGVDRKKALVGDNTPLIETEVAYLTLGPAAMITSPGELLPELFVGGYDGSYAGTWELVDPKSELPVDLTKAPKPPYLIDLMDGEREHRMVLGLTLDFVGYIVPTYDFILAEGAPYISEAPGDHYEETNSVGPRAAPEIVGTMRQLIEHGRAPAK